MVQLTLGHHWFRYCRTGDKPSSQPTLVLFTEVYMPLCLHESIDKICFVIYLVNMMPTANIYRHTLSPIKIYKGIYFLCFGRIIGSW